MVECPAGYNRCHIIISGSSHLDGLHCIGFVYVSGVWCACVLHVSIVCVCVYIGFVHVSAWCSHAYKLYTNSGFCHQKEDYISSCW